MRPFLFALWLAAATFGAEAGAAARDWSVSPSASKLAFVYTIDGEDRLSKVPVQTFESWRDLRRIEGAGIAVGTRIVHKGAHFVGDGDLVRVTADESR